MDGKCNKYPFEIKPLDPDEEKDVLSKYNDYISLSRVGPKEYFVPTYFKRGAADIYNMEVKPNDIWVASFQRSGTTWTQELVWLIANNLDYEKAKTSLTVRYSFLEWYMFFDPEIGKKLDEPFKKLFEEMSQPATDKLAEIDGPRFIKTHLPLSLLPPTLLHKGKVVYVARNPKDVIVSNYHQLKLFTGTGFKGDFKDFWNLFKNNRHYLTPYFEGLKEAWDKRHHPNMLFLFYEDLSKDLPASIRRVADFLDKKLTSDQITRLCDHLNIENFRKNPAVNMDEMKEFLDTDESFIRKGKTGGWREYFVGEMAEEVDRWIDDNLRNTDLRFSDKSN